MDKVTIIGTGLIGTSIGLALRQAGFAGQIMGIDSDPDECATALQMGAITDARTNQMAERLALQEADVIILAVPVLAILDWMHKLAPLLRPHQLVTDVGSTKLDIAQAARELFNKENTARFLPGHPMAGKETGGASIGEAHLLWEAMWLFTPVADSTLLEDEWRSWVTNMGCRTMDIEAARHDQLCAWVSHMPQMVATAMASLLEDEIATADEVAAIGGRALREMTRLGSSPYSMWRDVAMTNTAPIAATLFALEQRLAHIRENLKTPELREEFSKANQFRAPRK